MSVFQGMCTPSRLWLGNASGSNPSFTIEDDRTFVITVGHYTITGAGVDEWQLALNGSFLKSVAIDLSPYGEASYVEYWDTTVIGGDVLQWFGGSGGSRLDWCLSGYYWTPGDSGASATG